MVGQTKGSWRVGYIGSIVLFVAMLIAYMDRTNASILIANNVFLSDMGIAGRPDLAGLLFSVFLWAYGLTALTLSPLMDRLGARWGLIFLAIVWSLAMVIGGIAWIFPVIILSRVVLGIGEGLQVPINSMWVKHWAPPRERGIANAIWGSGMFVGSAVTMPIVASIVGGMGWRASFFILAAIALVVIIPLVLILVHNRPQESPRISREELEYIEHELEAERAAQARPAGKDESQAVQGWGGFIKNLNYWLSVLSWMFLGWMWWGLLSWLPSYLKTARGFTWGQMGWLSALPFVAGAAMILLSGFLMLRTRRSTLFLWTGKLVYAACLILAITSKSNLASALWMVGAMAGIGWSCGAEFVVLQKIIPPNVAAGASGLWQGVNQTTSGLIPYIMGLLIGASGSYNSGLYFLAISALVGALIGIVLYLAESKGFGKPLSATGSNARV